MKVIAECFKSGSQVNLEGFLPGPVAEALLTNWKARQQPGSQKARLEAVAAVPSTEFSPVG
jgi:hypothetical protein